ncbi:sigma-70 family RNA polymerase sigma factor [Myxococcaceae bacterium JPH2]|nr:sigma-70 family RNA polymerase sigma factor [Myxococcaceae bacterium JPH2]
MAKAPETGDHLDDLRLAKACAQGDAVALAEFEARFVPQVRSALSRRGVAPAHVDEVVQRLRSHVLVKDGEGPPRIAEYGGRGPLSAWLRMTALRLAWSLAHEPRAVALPDDSRLQALATAAEDVELGYLKDRYGADFNEAFRASLADLEPRSRTLLRMQVVEGLTTQQIARLYGVDRSSVKRWLASAREWLLLQTRQRFAARVGTEVAELGSLLEKLQSQLDVSIRLLMPGPEPR